jgi:hypothetical protein
MGKAGSTELQVTCRPSTRAMRRAPGRPNSSGYSPLFLPISNHFSIRLLALESATNRETEITLLLPSSNNRTAHLLSLLGTGRFSRGQIRPFTSTASHRPIPGCRPVTMPEHRKVLATDWFEDGSSMVPVTLSYSSFRTAAGRVSSQVVTEPRMDPTTPINAAHVPSLINGMMPHPLRSVHFDS